MVCFGLVVPLALEAASCEPQAVDPEYLREVADVCRQIGRRLAPLLEHANPDVQKRATEHANGLLKAPLSKFLAGYPNRWNKVQERQTFLEASRKAHRAARIFKRVFQAWDDTVENHLSWAKCVLEEERATERQPSGRGHANGRGTAITDDDILERAFGQRYRMSGLADLGVQLTRVLADDIRGLEPLDWARQRVGPDIFKRELRPATLKDYYGKAESEEPWWKASTKLREAEWRGFLLIQKIES